MGSGHSSLAVTTDARRYRIFLRVYSHFGVTFVAGCETVCICEKLFSYLKLSRISRIWNPNTRYDLATETKMREFSRAFSPVAMVRAQFSNPLLQVGFHKHKYKPRADRAFPLGRPCIEASVGGVLLSTGRCHREVAMNLGSAYIPCRAGMEPFTPPCLTSPLATGRTGRGTGPRTTRPRLRATSISRGSQISTPTQTH